MLLQAAAQVNDYLSAPSPLGNMVTAAGISAWAIHRMKEWHKIPWINDNSDKINRAISALLALATTLGLHFAFHTDTTGVHHGGIIEIGLPNATEFVEAAWRTLGSYIFQQAAVKQLSHEAGRKAVDVVAETVKEKKEELALEVEKASAPDGSVLGLKEPSRLKSDDTLKWEWDKKA